MCKFCEVIYNQNEVNNASFFDNPYGLFITKTEDETYNLMYSCDDNYYDYYLENIVCCPVCGRRL